MTIAIAVKQYYTWYPSEKFSTSPAEQTIRRPYPRDGGVDKDNGTAVCSSCEMKVLCLGGGTCKSLFLILRVEGLGK